MPVDRTDFQKTPLTVNAWYEVTYNSVTLPAGILQAPMFALNYPVAINYGNTGVTCAHETSHAFIGDGIQYGANGTLGIWMDAQSQLGLKNMTNCVVREFNNFCPAQTAPLCLNGQSNEAENIADQAGLRVAWQAYKYRLQQMGGIDPTLPLKGLEKYTSDQLFFISFGAKRCGSEYPQYSINEILSETHGPGNYRLLGALRNSPEFASTFNCKPGSKMIADAAEICYVFDNSP